MATMRLSVCVPVHDVAPFVGRCARSLFSQTVREGIEFVFVDDGSRDASVDEIDRALLEFPERACAVKIVRLPQCGGIGAARNRAMDEACGLYFAHCDADDWVEPTMYERLLAAVETSCADVAYCGMTVENRDGTWCKLNIPAYSSACEFVAAEMPSPIFNSPCNKIYSAALLKRAGARFSEDVSVGSDLLFNAAVFRKAGKIVACGVSPYHYRYNANSVSHRRAVSDGRAIIGFTDRIPILYPEPVYADARDRLYRNALLAGLRYGLLSSDEYRAMRCRLKGASWNDPRYGMGKRVLLAIGDYSPCVARCLAKSFSFLSSL